MIKCEKPGRWRAYLAAPASPGSVRAYKLVIIIKDCSATAGLCFPYAATTSGYYVSASTDIQGPGSGEGDRGPEMDGLCFNS